MRKNKLLVIGDFKHAKRKRSMVRRIAQELGYSLTPQENDTGIVGAIKWEPNRVGKTEYHLSYYSGFIANNHTCNISKTPMGNSFEKVFGYNINVNPEEYEGLVVKKSNGQGRHNGKIIQCPISKPKPACYQIFLNWRTRDGLYLKEYRIPVIGGEVPFVYYKKKTEEQKWKAGCAELEILPTPKAFSTEELAKINQFCDEINLDFAAIDIMRHPDTNKMYIIDVNNTPWGPPRLVEANPFESEYVFREVSYFFKKNLIKP